MAAAEMSGRLSKILETEEITNLSSSIVGKIEEHLFNAENEVKNSKDELKIQIASHHQESQELNKILNEKENALKQELSETETLKSNLRESETKCRELNESFLAHQSSFNRMKRENEQHVEEKKVFEDAKNKLLSVIDEKEKENGRINDELKAVSEHLANVNKNKYDMLIRSEEVQSQELMLQYQEKRLQQELEFSNQQINLLNNQILEKNEQILSSSSEKTSQILQLQSELESNADQIKLLTEKVDALNSTVDLLEKANGKKNEEIEGLKNNTVQLEKEYQQEIKAEQKLSDLYKKSSGEHSNKVTELIRAVEELQNFIEKSTQEHESLEKKYNDNIEIHEQIKNVAEQNITKLQEEIDHANVMLKSTANEPTDSVDQLYPEAATTSKLLKSGKSLTSLFVDYANVQQELLEQKQENEHLKKYLENVLNEVEEKAPILTLQRDDYEKALSTITTLNMKLDHAIKDREGALINRDKATRELRTVTRENQRFNRELIDFSSQIRLLLKEVEILRGNYIHEDEHQVSSSDETASGRVISKHLVTFKNIEELQEQNSKLLAVARELSEEQELKENNVVDERTSELKKDLESLQKQLEELRATRLRNETMLESVVRQRDMYKLLLAESNTKTSMVESSSKSPNAKSSEIEELMIIINQMKSDEKRFKEESTESMRILTDQLETMRNKSFEMKLENGRLTSQNEISTERIDVLQLRLDSGKKEHEIFKERNSKLSNLVVKYEETIVNLKKEILTTQSKLSQLEVSHQNLNSEYYLLKSREEIMAHEKDALTKEKKNQGEVLSNLQMLQANLERVEAERQLHSVKKIEYLETENKLLRKRVDSCFQENKIALQLWEKKLDEERGKLDKQVEFNRKIETECNGLRIQLAELKARTQSAKPIEITVAPAKVPFIETGKTTETAQSSVSKEEIERANSRIGELAAEIKLKNENLQSMKSLNTELELKMNESVEASMSLQKELENKINILVEAKNKAEDERHQMESKNREMFNELQESIQQNKSNSESMLNKLLQTKAEMQSLKERLTTADRIIKNARSDTARQSQLANEAEEKYKHELLNHATDLQEMSKYKEELEKSRQLINELEELKKASIAQAEEIKQSLKNQGEILKKNADDAVAKVGEVESQNILLHNQIQLMNTQINALKNSNESSTSLNVSFSKEEETESNQKLLEVVRYLRKEKELQSALYDKEKAENDRLSTQREAADNQIRALHSKLQDLKKQTEGVEADRNLSSKHSELIKKVEMMNLLDESNTMLRQDKALLEKKTSEQNTMIEAMRVEIACHDNKIGTISADKDVALSENVALRSEIKRWQMHVKQLTEQRSKFTPADFRKLTAELEDLKKKYQELTKESGNMKGEILSLTNENTSTKSELESLKLKSEHDKKEIGELKDKIQNSQSEKELVNKRKLIYQLRNLGKRYKELYTGEQETTTELQSKIKTVEKSLSDSQEILQEKDQKITEMDAEASNTKTKADEFTNKINELEKKLIESSTHFEANIKKINSENQKLNEKINELTNELALKKEEVEKAQEQSKAFASKSNASSNQWKTDKNNMIAEMEEYKLRLNILQSQREGSISRYEKEIDELRKNLAQSNKQVEELTAKSVQQKQLAQQQQISKPSTSSGPVVTTASSETRTANIKPMSSPTCVPTRHGPPSREAASSSASTSRMYTPTASIKPMAIGSSSATPVSRTATVMPTTTVVSVAVLPQSSDVQLETDNQVQTSSPSHVSVRHVVNPTSVHPSMPVSLPQQAPTVTVHPNVVDAATHSEGSDEYSIPTSGSAPMVVVSPQTSRLEASEPLGEAAIPSTSAIRMKRPRDDNECETAKRPKQQIVAALESTSQPQIIPSAIVTSSVSPHSVTPNPIEDVAEPSDMIAESSQFQDPVSNQDEDGNQAPNDDDDVIVVESDDDDDDDDEEATEESESGEEDEDDEEEDDELHYGSTSTNDPDIVQEYQDEEDDDMNDDDDEEEDYEQIEEDDDDQDMPVENNDVEDDNEVEIIDDQNDQVDSTNDPKKPESSVADTSSAQDPSTSVQEGASSSSSFSTPHSTAQVSSNTLPMSSTLRMNVPGRSERLPSFGRQQLAPFVVNHGQGYEEGDDSIVPSTPTLIVPRRNDGFAEAVSSPQVPQGRFVFANQNQEVNTQTSAPGVSLASQGALGVDDTRMDLLQFDDSNTGTGRSVPTTPLQVSSPGEEESIPEDRLSSQAAVATTVTSTSSQANRLEGEFSQASPSLDDPSMNQSTNIESSFDDVSHQSADNQPSISSNIPDTPISSVAASSSHICIESVASSSTTSVTSTASSISTTVTSAVAESIPESSTQSVFGEPSQSFNLQSASEADQGDQSKPLRKPITWSDPAPSAQATNVSGRVSGRGQSGLAARGRRMRIRGGTVTGRGRGARPGRGKPA